MKALKTCCFFFQNDKEVTRVAMKHFKEAFGKIVPSTQRGSDALVDLKPVSWNDIGGLEKVKGQIMQVCMMFR